jgi:hypothetical protein
VHDSICTILYWGGYCLSVWCHGALSQCCNHSAMHMVVHHIDVRDVRDGHLFQTFRHVKEAQKQGYKHHRWN